MATTVGAYFEERLGEPLEAPDPLHPASPYHPKFTVDTTCGRECRAAIDAAAGFVAHVQRAFGSDRAVRATVETARRVVRCYVHG